MVSKTKFSVNDTLVKKMFSAAHINNVTDIHPLGAGEYNSVYSASSNGKNYAVKIAPEENAPILTYEKNMMFSEVYWYKAMKEHTNIDVPIIYYEDYDKKIIPTNYFIMSKIDGTQLDKMSFNKEEKLNSIKQTAKMVAQIHNIKNDKFGYIQNELFDNWYLAIRSMTQNLIDDCKRKGKNSKRGEMLLHYIDKYKSVLEKAECTMVNFDVWAPNILCKRENDAILYSWIDPERSFWGDRIADFVCLEMMTPLDKKHISLQAYNDTSDYQVTANGDEKIRYAVAQGYLALIMEAEKYYRYSPRHFGWWRNVFASSTLYKKSFKELTGKK